MRNVLLYLRKSRDDENESKEETLARHERMLIDYCKRYDLKAKNDILKSFVDKIIYTKTIANHKHHSGRDDASVEIFLKI